MKRVYLLIVHLVAVAVLCGMPLRMAPALEQIVVWERTSGVAPTPWAFAPDDARLGFVYGDLTPRNCDFEGVANVELYDVYYSDMNGAPDTDGEYLSVTCVYPRDLPACGACNVALVELQFEDGRTQQALEVVSYVAGGRNKRRGTVTRAVDGDPSTHSTMGSTGEVERLRLTFRFFEMVSGVSPQTEDQICRM